MQSSQQVFKTTKKKTKNKRGDKATNTANLSLNKTNLIVLLYYLRRGNSVKQNQLKIVVGLSKFHLDWRKTLVGFAGKSCLFSSLSTFTVGEIEIEKEREIGKSSEYIYIDNADVSCMYGLGLMSY